MHRVILGFGVAGLVTGITVVGGATRGAAAPGVGDERAVTDHLDQAAVNASTMTLARLAAHGKNLFQAVWSEADGAGRPQLNGQFPPTNRNPRRDVEGFNRISGPDADSCAGCHNRPRLGGAGDNSANLLQLASRFSFFSDPSLTDENGTTAPGTLQNTGNERNTPPLFGVGALEMVAREMTGELQQLRGQALQQANATARSVRQALTAKGVRFGFLTARPGGKVDYGELEGIDPDLVVRPFGWKGTFVSIREITNHHLFQNFGIQPTERFGVNTDSDGDGVQNEATVGDVSALATYVAQFALPGQVIPRDVRRSVGVQRGDALFRQIGCVSCHVPELSTTSTFYTEPNPYNQSPDLRPEQLPRSFRFDLRRAGESPRPDPSGAGIRLRAFTDLKRHDLGSSAWTANETVREKGLAPGVFLTRPLWGVGSTPHYLHHGRATTLRVALAGHGGEADSSRRAFLGLDENDQASVVEFLKSLRVLPEGSRFLIVDDLGRPR